MNRSAPTLKYLQTRGFANAGAMATESPNTSMPELASWTYLPNRAFFERLLSSVLGASACSALASGGTVTFGSACALALAFRSMDSKDQIDGSIDTNRRIDRQIDEFDTLDR